MTADTTTKHPTPSSPNKNHSYAFYRKVSATVDYDRAPPVVDRDKKPLAFGNFGPACLRADILAPLPTTTLPLISRDRSTHNIIAREDGPETTTATNVAPTEQETLLFARHERALNSLAEYVQDPLNRFQLVEQHSDLVERALEFCATRPSRVLQERAAFILCLLAADFSTRVLLLRQPNINEDLLPSLKAAIQNGVRDVRQHIYATLEYLVTRPNGSTAASSVAEDANKQEEKENLVGFNIPQAMIDNEMIPILLERFAKKTAAQSERISLANILNAVAVYDCRPLLTVNISKPVCCLDFCMEIIDNYRDNFLELNNSTAALLQTLCAALQGKQLAANANLVQKLTNIALEAGGEEKFKQLRVDILQVLALITTITENKRLTDTFEQTLHMLEDVVIHTKPTFAEPLIDGEQEQPKSDWMRIKTRLHAITVLCNVGENPMVREHLRPFVSRRDVMNIYHDPNEYVKRAAVRLRKVVMWNP